MTAAGRSIGLQRICVCGVKKGMSQPSGNPIYIPPYSSVRLVECRDHIQLLPVASYRDFYGYGKIRVKELPYHLDDNIPPFADFCEPDEEIWIVGQWRRFEDGYEVDGSRVFLRDCTEEDCKKRLEEMRRFFSMTRDELLLMTRIFRATEEDYAYIDDNYPNYQSPPADPKATDEYDVYQARLKVLAGLQPKTIELIKIADELKNEKDRQQVEREAVQAYFAELAHYWIEDEILAWQRSNPVGTGWLCEFASVMHRPRRDIDSVNHELALNWLRRHYYLMTGVELSLSLSQRLRRWLSPWAIKKRRERLGLTTRRPTGPRPKSESQ